MILQADGIDELIAYLGGLEARIDLAVKRSIKDDPALRKMEADCNDITNSIVYSGKFEGDQSTPPQIKEGALAEITDQGVDVGMSMDPALLTIYGSSKGQNTYAMFLLPDYYEGSFLKGDAFAQLPIPFLDGWEAKLAETVPEAVSAAIDQELIR